MTGTVLVPRDMADLLASIGDRTVMSQSVGLPPSARDEQAWRAGARCATDPMSRPSYFFPETEDPGSEKVRWARGICAPCPVKRECLTSALARKREGIWAGTTERERTAALRVFGLELPRAVEYLLKVARIMTTRGEFRSARAEEWEEGLERTA